MILWGFDLGGTKIELVVLNYTENKPIDILFRDRVPTDAHLGYEHVVNQIHALLVLGQTKLGLKPNSVGIGTPGIVDREKRVIKNANVACINGQNLAFDLEKKWGISVFHTNDANAFILAETLVGAGKSDVSIPNVSFGIIIGTGVGGGWMIHGKLHEGPHGIAGEWGHTYVGESSDICYCSKTGCLETFISGGALERYYASLSGTRKPLAQVYQDYVIGGDLLAQNTLDRLVDFLAKALAQVVNTIDPDMVILGGGVSKIDYIYEKLPDAMLPHVFNPNISTPILKHTLGESAGVIGAALLCLSTIK